MTDLTCYDAMYDFDAQFPYETVTEVLPAEFNNSTNEFPIKRLNIGWALSKSYSKKYNAGKSLEKLADGESIHDRKIMKKCAGALPCINEDCEQGYNVDIRPPIATRDSFKCIKKHNCMYCDGLMQIISCHVSVSFTFRVSDITRENRGSTVTMVHNTDKVKHTHRFYNSLHLARWEKKELNKKVKETPNLTAAAAIAGIDPATGAIIKRSIGNINKVLGNYGRATFEINRSKIQQGIVSSTNDVVAEFEDLEKQYPEFIDSAQILSSKFFVSFCSPEMVKGALPFADQPIITDVTFKAVPKGYYLCSSAIYMKKLDKHVVFFQAIIKSNSTQVFQQYFVALFKKFDIKPEKFLGMVMGFSAAQREEFLLAFHQVFGLKAHNALPFLKGCYMHWMQSVKRILCNHQIVKPQHLDLFLTLIHRFRTTGSIAVFFKTVKELLVKFPNCKRWLQWWLQPGVSSMIFKCKSLMKDELREHKTRTSNAIEAFHSALYKLMPKRQPVSTSLRLLLQVAQRDGVMLVDFFENQVRPFYGKKKKSSTKKYATLYEINDGRAPDNNTALFGVKKRKQEVVIIDDDEESKPKAKKVKRHEVELNAALEEYLDEVDKTCLKIDDDVEKDDEKDEKLFLELLEADDVEIISEDADNEFERTEDLDKDIKNMFNELGINVENTFESDEKYESCVIDLVSSSSSSSPSSPETADITRRSPILSQAIFESCNSQPLEPSSNKSTDAIDILSDSESFPVDELILPEKRPHLLQQYRYIAYAYDCKIREEYPSLAMNVYIRSNQNNSCFIDASFELLFNAVLPFVDMPCIDSNNNYDCLLKDAFDLYSLQKNLAVDTAIGNVRNFFWNMEVNGARKMVKSFPNGREGDAVKLLSIILERLSDVLAKKICDFSFMKCERKISCSAESSHSHTREDYFSNICMLPTTIIKSLREHRGFLDEAALGNVFTSLFRDRVLEEQQFGKFKCNVLGCYGNSKSYKILPKGEQFPPFLFIQDGANFTSSRFSGNNVYMPTYINILDDARYKLHGRVYSTCFTGSHFFTRCYKTINGIVYLVEIDNLGAQKMKVLTSDLDEAKRILKDVSNTVYACYKKI